jgi:hypothetical protein
MREVSRARRNHRSVRSDVRPGSVRGVSCRGFLGVLINRKLQADKGTVVEGVYTNPGGTALLFPGGEMYLSTTSRGDLIVWKRNFRGRFSGIHARVPAGAIQTIESDKNNLRTKVTFLFSDGSNLRVNVNGKVVFDAFSASLLPYGVESILV